MSFPSPSRRRRRIAAALTAGLALTGLAVVEAREREMAERPMGDGAVRRVVDFADDGEAARWVAVNDGVMGGISRGALRGEAGVGVFYGVLSLENGGGFASVRRLPGPLGLAGSDSVSIRVRGDGRAYQLRFRTDDGFDGVAHAATFATAAGAWITVSLPWSEFRPTFRGRSVPAAEAFDPARARQAAFLIADKREGPFRLEVGWIGVSPGPRGGR